MSTFKQDFNYVWNKPNNSLIRIIIINVAIFLAVNFVYLISPSFFKDILYNLMIPSNLGTLAFKPWTIITSFFTHEGFRHIFWNMLMLYWFGVIFTEFLQNRKLIAVYILGGLAGGITYVLCVNFIPAFATEAGYALGASASVNAIIVACATLNPDYRINLFLIGPVKLKYLALVTVILSLFGLRGSNVGGDLAHLGGALMGFVYIKQYQAGSDWGAPILKILDWFSNLTKPKTKLKVYKTGTSKAKKGASKAGNPDQSVVDRILDKISESGYDKLTQEEKQILFRASQKKGQHRTDN